MFLTAPTIKYLPTPPSPSQREIVGQLVILAITGLPVRVKAENYSYDSTATGISD